ncbi:hypothetical protein Pve01_89590 [Planomonospora venezuelensis]|nr:hypothetical protein Pve01_89590 [Planomonospora venezuelensis]
MTSTTKNISTVTAAAGRAIAVGIALAGLTAGLVGAGTSAASAHEVSSLSLRGGDDDPPGDDDGGHSGDDDGTHSGGGDDDRVIVTGRCSSGADWKLKVKTDDGRLEVEGEVDSNVAGQRWRWALRHNGSVSDRGVSTTTARSGSFEVERRMVNLAGTDRVVFRAVHDGQTCRGVVNY